MLGFILWEMGGFLMICIGISCFFTKRTVGFWANARPVEIRVTDRKKYNSAVGKLFCLYGVVFLLLGIPMLSPQPGAGVLLSIMGTMVETIAAMILYVLVIEKKYRK